MAEHDKQDNTPKAAKPKSDGGASQIESVVKEGEEKGYLALSAATTGDDGTSNIESPVDPTPNENYTLQGVTSGKPTPETDPELRAEARRKMGRRL